MEGYDTLIREHYRREAEECGASPRSTMREEVVRSKEVQLIGRFLETIRINSGRGTLRVLDAGCGNGYTLDCLSRTHAECELQGLEFTEELAEIAQARQLEGCIIQVGDVRRAPFPDGYFDVVYTERCLINILDYAAQLEAVREIGRILRPAGHYLMVECFDDGLQNNNKARVEMGLEAIEPAHHNLYLKKNELFRDINDWFEVVDLASFDPDRETKILQSNFLSSHFFVARVLHPLLTRGDWVRNSEFVKFFSFLPPAGNYAPIQAFALQRRPGAP